MEQLLSLLTTSLLSNKTVFLSTIIGVFMIVVFLSVLIIIYIVDAKEKISQKKKGKYAEIDSRKHDLLAQRREELLANLTKLIDTEFVNEESVANYEQSLNIHLTKIISDESTLSLFDQITLGKKRKGTLEFSKWVKMGEQSIRIVNLSIKTAEHENYNYYAVFVQMYNVNNTKAYLLYFDNIPVIYQDINIKEVANVKKSKKIEIEEVANERNSIVMLSKVVKDKFDNGLFLDIFDYNEETKTWDMITAFGEKLIDFTHKKPKKIEIVKSDDYNYKITVLTEDGLSSERLTVSTKEFPYAVSFSPKTHESRKILGLDTNFNLILGLKSNESQQLRTLVFTNKGKIIKCLEKTGGIIHNVDNVPFTISSRKEFTPLKEKLEYKDNSRNLYSSFSEENILVSRRSIEPLDEIELSKDLSKYENNISLNELCFEEINYISEHFISFNKCKYFADETDMHLCMPLAFFSEIYELNKWSKNKNSNRWFWNYTIKNEVSNEIIAEFQDHKELYDRREYENKTLHESKYFSSKYEQKYFLDKENFVVKHREGRVRLCLPVFARENIDLTILNGYENEIATQIVEEINFKTKLPLEFTGHDELYIPFDKIKNIIPEAKDAISSPDGELLFVLTNEFLQVYVLGKNQSLKSPKLQIRVSSDEEIVKKQWVNQKLNDKVLNEKMETYYRTRFYADEVKKSEVEFVNIEVNDYE